MIFIATDFGQRGPYAGSLHAVLQRAAPDVPRIDLMHDLPRADPRRAAFLLERLMPLVDRESVVLAVVDPGVGGPRRPLIASAAGRWLVGPDNGLFEMILRRYAPFRRWEILEQPASPAKTFHGRDLFAPAAARLAVAMAEGQTSQLPGAAVKTRALEADEPRPGSDWPDDLAEVIYIDDFGNAMTGLGGEKLDKGAQIVIAGGTPAIEYRESFSAAPEGAAFWYVNSLGLVEIALNRGRAEDSLSLAPGAAFEIDGKDAGR